MKSSFLRGIVLLAVLVPFTAIGYYGYRWYAAHEKKKALGLYFRKNSPVTRRMPEDATLYLNLFNARRLLDAVQDTRFSRVYAHWLDTGMGEENHAPNSLMGGMLEKTLLNVFGEELGIALSPGPAGDWDFTAVAHLAPGSDFLLKLALSQDKKLERIESGDRAVYALRTRNPKYPRIFLYVDSDFAYASNSIERIRRSFGPEGGGPSFLEGLPDETLPENTFLFFKSNTPEISALGFLEGKRLYFHTECDSRFEGPIPFESASPGSVLELLTNVPEIFHQPAAAYSLRNVEGATVSTVLLAFGDVQQARDYGRDLRRKSLSDRQEDPPETIVNTGKFRCTRFPYRKQTGMLCESGTLLWLADGMIDPGQILSSSGVYAARKRPLTLRIAFNRAAVTEFATLADNGDWSLFAKSKALYFLGCLHNVEGGVDEARNVIMTEIE